MAEQGKHRHAGHRQRMKTEFLTRGLEGWPDHRVLELLLFYAIPQGDVNAIAHDLIDRFGSLAGVLDASVDELTKVLGVGEHTALLLRLIPALGRRYQMDRSDLGKIINSIHQAEELLGPYFFGARNEMVYGLFLDSKRKALGSDWCQRAASLPVTSISGVFWRRRWVCVPPGCIWPITTSAIWPFPPTPTGRPLMSSAAPCCPLG